jgi:hypothetical protein
VHPADRDRRRRSGDCRGGGHRVNELVDSDRGRGGSSGVPARQRCAIAQPCTRRTLGHWVFETFVHDR